MEDRVLTPVRQNLVFGERDDDVDGEDADFVERGRAGRRRRSRRDPGRAGLVVGDVLPEDLPGRETRADHVVSPWKTIDDRPVGQREHDRAFRADVELPVVVAEVIEIDRRHDHAGEPTLRIVVATTDGDDPPPVRPAPDRRTDVGDGVSVRPVVLKVGPIPVIDAIGHLHEATGDPSTSAIHDREAMQARQPRRLHPQQAMDAVDRFRTGSAGFELVDDRRYQSIRLNEDGRRLLGQSLREIGRRSLAFRELRLSGTCQTPPLDR